MEINIFIGVLSGVITSVGIFFVKILWDRVISPWYKSIIYSGADLSGSWFAEYSEPELDLEGNETGGQIETVISMALEQNAHQISGSIHLAYHDSNRKVSTDYNVTGEYWEGYVNLYCRTKDRKTYSHGSMFLKLINNGTGLLGQFSFRNAFTDKVTSMHIGIDRN